jgi:NADH:ubiquinone reductase (H+-translocating)
MQISERHRVVIIGAGFGGLNAARGLKRAPVDVTVIDRRNFHLFQPLLYQVATGGLSPGDISSPIRSVLKHQKNVRVLLGEVIDIDVRNRRVALADGEQVAYDTLIVATGASHDYFGHPEWAGVAPGLKTIEDATDIRRRIFLAFETAERETDPKIRAALLTFVVVGGGPTGVELAGALGEIANDTLKHDFRNIDPESATILLIEGNDRILTTYPATLSTKAERSLVRLGVTVINSTYVVEVDNEGVDVRDRSGGRRILARTILWAAGVKASSLAYSLVEEDISQLERGGQLKVERDLTLPRHPEIIVLGDLAIFTHQTGAPLPGVAPVAMQQGTYASKLIRCRLQGEEIHPFHFYDKGTMATIGRASAVGVIGGIKLWGYPAWLAWLFIHLMYLVEFENRLLVLIQWAWNYLTFNRGARLITGEDRLPVVGGHTVSTVSKETRMKQ